MWFDLKFREEELNSEPALKEWLEDCGQRVFQALQDSNFNIEAAETYLDLVSYGTSILVEEPEEDIGWNGVNFQSVPIRECYFEEDSRKQVLRLYRNLSWTPMQIIDKFGEDKVPATVLTRSINPESANTKMQLVFCIYRREDKKDVDTSGLLAPKNRPFGFKYILVEGKEEMGEEGGYYEMPAFVARWRKTAGSRWGHSPAAVAMGDILTLNQLKEAVLMAAGKVIDPVILTEEVGMFGDLDMEKGGINVVGDITKIAPFESGSRFDVGAMQIDWLQQAIEKAFYQDQLQMKESPAMTATEVNVRYEMMQRLLGPTLGRLQNDFLDPLIQRTFNIMYRAGALMEIPEGHDIGEMDIEYTGPLPRAQKKDTAMAIQNWIGGVAQLAEIFPEALDRVDIDAAVKELALLDGVPSKLIKDDKEVEEAREAKEEEMKQAQGMAKAQQGGEAAQAVGKGAQELHDGGITDEQLEAAAAEGGQGQLSAVK